MTDYLLKDAFSLVRHNRFKQLNNFIDKNEIEVDEQDDKGNTMLLVACQNGHKRMAKIVLRRGANINIQNYLGNTPLHFCFQYGFAKLGAYLITKGADPEIRNNNGFLCTEGLGRNALLTFNQAIEERQRIVEERNLDEDQDWDDGASSVGCLTDRSDFNDGQLTDRSIVMTDRSNYDGFDNNLNGFGLETFTEGVEEETAAEEEYYYEQQQYENNYDYNNNYNEVQEEGQQQQQQESVVISEEIKPLPIQQIVNKNNKKKSSWRPLPTQPKPRPLPTKPRPLPPISLPNVNKNVPPAKNNNNTLQQIEISKKIEQVPNKLDNKKAPLPKTAPPPKYNSLIQAFHAKDIDEMKEMIKISSRVEISATLQAASVSGGAIALPILLPYATNSIILRCIGTMAANNRLRSLHTILKYIRENEVLIDDDGHVYDTTTNNNNINKNKQLIIKLPKTLISIDRALARAAGKGRVRASTLLAQYASNNAIVQALCSAAHHKKANVVKQVLPWAESTSLDQLVTTASTKGDADVMLLLIPYLSTQCEIKIVDHAIESAVAHGHLPTVAILWKFASMESQTRCLDIAKHHKRNDLVAEIEKGEGIFSIRKT